MHRYATDTCQHLFTGARQIYVWQHDIPAMAASNVVLMHGILAVTAIHCALSDPTQRDAYKSRALYHHSLSLPMFQAMVASAASETAEVIVAYSILLSIWQYAYPELADEQPALDDIFDMIELVRGTRSVSRLYRDIVVAGPMGVFFDPQPSGVVTNGQISSVHQTLQSLHDQLSHPADQHAVQRLQVYLDRYETLNNRDRLAVTWMATIADDFWVRLRSYNPHALLVLAYSTLLVYASGNKCWWMSGWSERILRACGEVLSPGVQSTIDWAYHESRIRGMATELGIRRQGGEGAGI